MTFTLVSVDLVNGGSLSLKSPGSDVSQNIGVRKKTGEGNVLLD